ncbi:hypothetical protein TanjilG_00033 [Lupinus angustifolius]|uniref:Uncharacterized protein n=1 Tax=Lupinus angustifolius TaxID=3871 RepID=A0A4P1QSV1_LUPAN|nr:PREDICTED: uncharacterized protein LOC109331503 [Lupinus angustifolius]XP_019421589.1 PREDICTED: uncharacterized protein LOC109331503 [Lupinus angustifolius]XP_019421590.1 PREDICTED: uncharacterized protein LOC109331503 [Lupinus angustifolius]OIV94284.1 hypothetical protein TanjilG_00033 [Lupinus angustifolius]
MDYQSFGKPQRPKGANIKQALKLMLVLAVCAWFVYQMKHSIRNKTENHGFQTKLDTGDATIPLGRKGTPSRLDGIAFPNSGNEDSSESSSGSDDLFDEAKKLDKSEEEFGHVNEKLKGNEEKEVELEPENQSMVSSKNEDKDSSKEESAKVYVELSRSESSDEEHSNDPRSYDKETAKQLREPQHDDHVTKNAKSDFSRKENDEEISTNAGLTEGIDEVQTFHDETGVPPDFNETETIVGQARAMHEESTSDFSKGSSIGEASIFEVTSRERNNVEVTLEGTKNDATADEGINTARMS